MRRAYHDGGFEYEGDTLRGVALGYDFTAEHEWGTEAICDALGVGRAADMGLDACRVTQVPGTLDFYSGDGEAVLSLSRTVARELVGHRELRFYGDEDFVAAWSGSDFAIRVRGERGIEALEVMHTAFLRCDVVVGMKRGAWIGSGLTLAVASEFTDEERAEVLARHESDARLARALEESGIEERLREAGRRYFALQPKWVDDEESSMRLWLNPMEQRENNAGWFTLGDLEAWIEGSGPVPKGAA